MAPGHASPQDYDQFCGCIILSLTVCLGHVGKERGRAVESPSDGELDLLGLEEARQTWRAQKFCAVREMLSLTSERN